MPRFLSLCFLLALSACGDDPTPHDVVQCDASWDPITAGLEGDVTCERACETVPANHTSTGEDMPCMTTHPVYTGDSAYWCKRSFDADGIRGCCYPGHDGTPNYRVMFWECVD